MEIGAIGVGRIVEWGPLAMGWVAWVLTLLVLRTERAKYQELVILFFQIQAKLNMAERKTTNDSPSTIEAVIKGLSARGRRGQSLGPLFDSSDDDDNREEP